MAIVMGYGLILDSKIIWITTQKSNASGWTFQQNDHQPAKSNPDHQVFCQLSVRHMDYMPPKKKQVEKLKKTILDE